MRVFFSDVLEFRRLASCPSNGVNGVEETLVEDVPKQTSRASRKSLSEEHCHGESETRKRSCASHLEREPPKEDSIQKPSGKERGRSPIHIKDETVNYKSRGLDEVPDDDSDQPPRSPDNMVPDKISDEKMFSHKDTDICEPTNKALAQPPGEPRVGHVIR